MQTYLETLSKEWGQPPAPTSSLHSLPSPPWPHCAFTRELRGCALAPAPSTRVCCVTSREQLKPSARTRAALGIKLVPAQSVSTGSPPATAQPQTALAGRWGRKKPAITPRAILLQHCLQCSTGAVTTSPPVKQDSNLLNSPLPGKRNRLARAHSPDLLYGGNTSTARLLQSFKMVHNLQA